MRIKHRPNEFYYLYSLLPCQSNTYKDVKIWYPYKIYHSKQAALNAIKRIREKHMHDLDSRLLFKIVWFPYPFADKEQSITVYNEFEEVI